MIDPVSAFALASSAFTAVKRLVETGREIEDVAGYIGKFFDGAATVKAAHERAENPSPFRKLLDAGSVEQEALQVTVQKQKILEMEGQLREMIVYAYGTDVYKEMLREREQIRMRRIRAEMERDAMRENMIWGSAVLFVFGLLCYVTYIAVEALA